MPLAAAYARRGIKGGCKLAHIPGGLNAGVTGVIACDDLSTWVGLTTNGQTRLMVNRTAADAEEIAIEAVAGNNITITTGGRGLNGTSDATHAANCTIEVIDSPTDADEANYWVAELGAAIGAALDLPYGDGDNSLTKLAATLPWKPIVPNQAANALVQASGYPIFIYADAAARDAAITAPAEGMFCWLTGTDVLTYYTGAAWANYGPSADGAEVLTQETTTSTSYTDLTTAGPAATVTIGSSGRLFIQVGGWLENSGLDGISYMSFALSGANTLAAADARSVFYRAYAGVRQGQYANGFMIEGLAAGSTVCTAKHRVDAGTGTFINRRISAIAL